MAAEDNDLIHQQCGLIVTIGTAWGSETVATAKANPQVRFALVDAADVRGTSNLLSIQFKAQEAAFLAGYLAAATTKTGTVGTFGAIPIPTVTRYMDGFAAGASTTTASTAPTSSWSATNPRCAPEPL